METKVCSKCGKELQTTTEYFYARKDSKDGFRNECKECTRKRINQYVFKNTEKVKETRTASCKKYRLNNKEKISKQSKQYNIKNKDKKNQYRLKNKEHIANTVKLYSEKHKEHLTKIYRQYTEDNKEILAKQQKQWAQKNRDKCNNTHQKYNAKKLLLPYMLTIIEWNSIKKYFNNYCCYCGREKPLAQEHFICVDSGGGYTKENIVPSCKSCNSSKRNKNFNVWYKSYKFYTKEREDFILEYLKINKDEQLTSAI